MVWAGGRERGGRAKPGCDGAERQPPRPPRERGAERGHEREGASDPKVRQASGRMLDRGRARALVGMEPLTLLEPALDEPLLTADQVAVLLAVPRSSVYEYARRLQQPLPSIRIGRHRRFLRSDVLAWLRALREL